MTKPRYRYLRGYTLDPGFSTQLDTTTYNETTYRIRWEDLTIKVTGLQGALNWDHKLGPCGEYFEVIDVDPSSKCFYEPVNLDAYEVLSQHGLSPSEGNPKFHQQFVYTIAMKTLEQFEQALGRILIWDGRDTGGKNKRYVDKIRLYPHALREANAYYSTQKKGILFGYFKAAMQTNGSNFPGGTVFTCLSPDIIAHEVTHAIVDSIHPRYLENTNRDVPAFHEGFADIIALLQRFTISDLVVSQLSSTGGSLDRFNLLGELATQFGTALAQSRGALRSAIGQYNKKGKWERRKPDPSLYESSAEPHERGSILVAVFFDALIKVYNFKTADLIRIATNGSGILQEGAISSDLAKRLAQEVCEIASHLQKIAVRALDYCPPVDITFGDFLRALITADIDFASEDENDYRIALIDAFRSWGVFPDWVNTLSQESLQWAWPPLNPAQEAELKRIAAFLQRRVRVVSKEENREAIFDESIRIQNELEDMISGCCKEALGAHWADWLDMLGLSATSIVFSYGEGKTVTAEVTEKNPPRVQKVRPAFRIGRDGIILEQVIVVITQSMHVKVEVGAGTGDMIFRGGSTIIFNNARDGSANYVITKFMSQERFNNQLNYQQGNATGENAAFSKSVYEEPNGFQEINFAHLHFH